MEKEKIKEILEKMSLEQRCALLSGGDTFKTRGFEQFQIPQMWLSDGPHGLRKQAGASDHLGMNPSVKATCFPTAATAACSWDPELGERVGEALGEEAAAEEVSVLLGPGLNIKRNPLCGRNFEYFSEDPLLAGKMAAGYVRGIQKNGISACPKHFAVNSQETRRMASDSIVDERTLREIYLTGFEITVKESDPKMIMTSYNLINGTYANENEHLLKDILKDEWGYKGTVVTDWGGSNDHALGVKYGSALEMPAPGGGSVRELTAAIQSGKITEADVNARCEELLSLILETKEALDRSPREYNKERHHDLARQAAGECLTLLKNEQGFLPLKEGTKAALIGDFAETPRYQGAGSSLVNCTRVDSLLKCLPDTGIDMVGFEKGFLRGGASSPELAEKAKELAKKADVVIFCMGLDEVKESEGLDRGEMKLAKNQTELLHEIAQINPNIAVVLFCGSTVETGWAKDCKALLYAGLGGQAGAGAAADALVGKINPCGKLAETWPVCYEDNPAAYHFAGKKRTTEYREGLFVGYRYYQKAKVKTAFPFGYGLSYTSFAYSGLKADEKKAVFTVTNTGSCAGTEIAQVYVQRTGKAGVIRPVRELKGFARVTLEPGESREVTVLLPKDPFRYYNVETKRWETEEGTYEIQAASSSEKIELSEKIRVKGTGAPNPYEGKHLGSYRNGTVQKVPDAEFKELLGREIPSGKPDISRNMTFGELICGRSPIGWIVWAVLTILLKSSLKKGKPNLNLLFIYNMPFRALAKMTGGGISMGMVDGIVMELKGFWIIGIIRVLYEFIINLVQNAGLEKRLKQG